MHQRVRVLLCTVIVFSVARPVSADAADQDPSLAIAVEMYVDPVLAVRAPEMDPSRYETYVRELFRGIAPETPVVTEGAGARNASHVLVMDFSPAEQRGEVRVTVSMKLGRGVTRRLDLARVAATTVEAADAVALESFLRQQVSRVVALYQLRGGRASDETQEHGRDRTIPIAELGMTLVVDSRVRGPAVDAMSSAIRTTLASALPGVTLVGPFVSAQEAGTERPMLAVEIVRLDRETGDTSTGGGRNRVRITLTDRERGELLRADEVYDDGDAERALRFLRETIRTVAGKLLEDPLLFPIVSLPDATTSGPGHLLIEREWGNPPHVVPPTNAVAAPDAQTRVPVTTTLPRWRRIVRASEIVGVALGVVTLGFGTWQGLAAHSAASDYRHARVQLEAEDAKQRSEERAKLANSLFVFGAAAVAIGGTSIVLDLSGVYDRWSGCDGRPSAITVLPTDHGVVGTWSVSIP